MRAPPPPEPEVAVDALLFEEDPLASTLGGDDDAESPRSSRASSDAPALTFEQRYRMLGRLGAGSMGEVYLCLDRPFGREVAMKVLRGNRSSSRWRFVREARVQGQLGHPSVVPVYDLGTDPEGHLYFTMKRVRGVRLDDVLRARNVGDEATFSFSRRRLLSRFSQVCLSLHYAHSRGVVHRDVKPANMMLGEFGETYVMDWGLAKVLTEKHERPIDDASGAMQTTDGSVLGTMGYMAPEQLRGEVERVGPRSDIYSLGIILCELLTDEPVHSGSAATRALSALSIDGASPRATRPDAGIPAVLDDLCVASTRLDPSARPSSALALADAVERWLESPA